MTIPLIDKQDNFEIVGTQIAAILAQETLNQQALATAAGEDPTLWEFDVFSERMNPWERFQEEMTPTPVVNVWYDTSNFSEKDGNTVAAQKDSAVYNIDVYAAKPAMDNPQGGYYPPDQTTVLEVHRVTRLIRNILMHPDNTYLQLKRVINGKEGNLVWKRWIRSKEKYQPQENDRPVPFVIACRTVLSVEFNEVPVTETFPTIEIIAIDYKLDGFGKVKVEQAEFNIT
jgi:hypothetical protein